MSRAEDNPPSQQGRFLTGSTMGHVVRMTMTGAAGITFVFLVDAANLLWISMLGDPRLVAATGFAFAIQFLAVSVGIGLMIAANALVARAIGSGAIQDARRIATSSILIATTVQCVTASAVILFRHDIVALIGATGDTAQLAARYLAISMVSLPLMAASLIASGALRAQGDGARAMYVTLFSGIMAMFLDPLLIVGMGLGLDGAAIGIGVFRCAMLGLALYYTITVHDLLARPSVADILPRCQSFFAIAGPAILTQLATPTGNYLATTVIARFGDDAVAGWAVVGRMTTVAFGGIFSLSGAIGGIFGQNYGARLYDRIVCTYRDALIFGLCYSLVTWAVLYTASPLIVDAFALRPDGARVVYAFAAVGAGGFVFAAALFVSNAAFNSLGRPGRSTLTNWLRDGILTLPLALMFTAWLGGAGVVHAQAAASVLTGSVAAIWGWHYVRWLSRASAASAAAAPTRAQTHPDRYRRR